MNQDNIEIQDISTPPPIVNNKEVGKGKQPKEADIDLVNCEALSRVETVLNSIQRLNNIQEIGDNALNGLRMPTVNRMAGMSRYFIPQDASGVPCFPSNLVVGSLGRGSRLATGTGATALTWNYLFENAVVWLTKKVVKLKVKNNAKTTVKLMSELTVLKEKANSDLARMVRAAPTFSAADWVGFITDYNLDTTTRSIRTDAVAQWMYNNVSNASGNLYVINASDYRNYMQTTLNESPIPATTLMLDLKPNLTDATLGKLALLDQDIILDWSNTVTNNGTYNGLGCRIIPKQNVNACDTDIAQILSRTYCVEDLDWALFLSALPFMHIHIAAGDEFWIPIFENTIQDQAINFWYRDFSTKGNLPDGSVTNDLQKCIFDFRIAKTCLFQKAQMPYGCYGYGLYFGNTFQTTITMSTYANNVFGLIEVNPNNTTVLNVMWVPFEFWIANGAKLELDGYRYVQEENQVPTNAIFRIPESQTTVSLADWNANVNGAGSSVNWYTPNVVGPTLTTVCNNYYQSCLPLTVLRHGSTAFDPKNPGNIKSTMSIDYMKECSLRTVVVNSGGNRNTAVYNSLGF